MTEEHQVKAVDMLGWWPSVEDLLDGNIAVEGGVQTVGDLVLCPSTSFHFGFPLVSFIVIIYSCLLY